MEVEGKEKKEVDLLWKEGMRRNRTEIVKRLMGDKEVKLKYTKKGGKEKESVEVAASRRRQWSLTDEEVHDLGRMALVIEDHYGMSMDIEWAKDGYSGELFIVQARPETVHSNGNGHNDLITYSMAPELAEKLKDDGKVLATGHAVGTRIGTGRVRVYQDYEEVIVRKRALRNLIGAGRTLQVIPAEERVFDPGDVLVTEMTTPDWEPMMK